MTARLAFTCPRCTTDVEDEFYGPCATCRDELVATMRGEAKDVEATAYEPKMNVVPNQVATKD
jgi:hypothetical protein